MFLRSFASKTQNWSENSKPFWRLRLGRWSVECPQNKNITAIINMTATKYDSYLLQNATGFLLQNATILLQNVIVQNTTIITKCDVYYKLWQYKVYSLKNLWTDWYWYALSSHFLNYNAWNRYSCSCVFRTLSNIYDLDFLRKGLTELKELEELTRIKAPS